MFTNKNQELIFIKVPSILIVLLPISLVSGPFFSDLTVSIISILFLILLFKVDLSKYYKSIFFKLFLLFYLFINIASIIGVNPFYSLKNSFFYLRHGLFVLYFWFLLDNNYKLKTYLFNIFVITFTCLIIDGFIQYFLGSNLLGFPIASTGRISSFFGEELILGSYLSRLFPIIFCLLIVIYNKNFSKINIVYIFILFLTGDVLIFLSGERTALFLLNISTIYIIFFVSKFKYLRLAAFISAMIIIVIISSFNPTAKKRMIDQTFHQMGLKEQNEIRVNKQFHFIDFYVFSQPHEIMIKTGLNMFENNKIFGGSKNYRTECRNKDNYIMGYSCSTHPHNTYIQLLSETGIFGFAIIFSIFVWFVFENFKMMINSLIYKKKYNDGIICIYACFLMTLWPIMPTGSFFTNWLSIIYFFPIGIYLHLKDDS